MMSGDRRDILVQRPRGTAPRPDIPPNNSTTRDNPSSGRAAAFILMLIVARHRVQLRGSPQR
ncbi:MAG: hypothetical protein PHI71_01875 [Acidiphilium sp.]|nr:hypothetical protein [Acidiphilium sp.]